MRILPTRVVIVGWFGMSLQTLQVQAVAVGARKSHSSTAGTVRQHAWGRVMEGVAYFANPAARCGCRKTTLGFAG